MGPSCASNSSLYLLELRRVPFFFVVLGTGIDTEKLLVGGGAFATTGWEIGALVLGPGGGGFGGGSSSDSSNGGTGAGGGMPGGIQ